MATAPYKIVDRRSSQGYSNNNLFEAAARTSDRKFVRQADTDFHRNISNFGRRTLMTLGRHLFVSSSPVRGAITEMATYAAGQFIPQYTGRNPAWGRLAEQWMAEHDKICDVRGAPFSMETWKRSLIVATLRDGDKGTLLTQSADGYPMIQSIAGHRIGSKSGHAFVDGGEYDGARMVDGVIINDYGRPLAYRIYGDTDEEFQDVSVNDMFISFLPDWDDQARGISTLATSAFDWQDIAEARRLELLSQKLNASIGMIEKNETGEADENGGLTIPAADGTEPAGVRLEKASGGLEVRYFKANAGQGLEAVVSDKPTMNQREFTDSIIRAALNGIGWSSDFSLDPSKVGGASMRVVVAKINATIRNLQRFILLPACRRVDGWRISKAIKLGLLPKDPDWFSWKYQGPAKITADEKYQSSVSIEEMRAGLTSLKTEAEKRGEYWEDVQDDAIEVEKRLQSRCKEEGVDPNRIVLLTPNGNPPSTEEPIALP